jgi:stalled ribosome rescue protein Dom34
MKRVVGIWIDHKKAVIVNIVDDTEEIMLLDSGLEKHVRISGEAERKSEGDHRDRKFMNHLNKYYDEVIFLVRDTDSILIVGPGEAKIEFKKRLEINFHAGRKIDIETVDKMTNRQITAKIRNHFLN